MKREFFVWAHASRLPSIADIINTLAAAGFPCRPMDQPEGEPDPQHWRCLRLELDAEGQPQSCLVTVLIPSWDDISELAEQYENLPMQAKHAARKYIIAAESDEYGQATLFQLRVVASIAKLIHGVVEDPQESGLMLLDEFEAFIAAH